MNKISTLANINKRARKALRAQGAPTKRQAQAEQREQDREIARMGEILVRRAK